MEAPRRPRPPEGGNPLRFPEVKGRKDWIKPAAAGFYVTGLIFQETFCLMKMVYHPLGEAGYNKEVISD